MLIVFSLHRESFKLILVDEPPPRGGSVIGEEEEDTLGKILTERNKDGSGQR
jgi:hypothetical protein